MRFIPGFGLLLIAALSAFPQTAEKPAPAGSQNLQTGYCPQTHQLEAEPSQKFFFDGTIGKRHVRMYLDRGGSGVVGLFFDIDANWEITLLGGTWNNGQVDASNANPNPSASGRLRASLANNRLTGLWTTSDIGQPDSVELITISEPRCDGKETWKGLNDPEWPMTFSYPASWHLEQTDDDSVILTCPNPSAIAFNQHIVIHRGTGSPHGPTQLVQCGTAWIYGDGCNCNQKDQHACPTAKVSRLASATILDVSEQEHRIYCLGGGYVAAGEGEDRVLLLGDQWLEINAPVDASEIVNRLANSVTARKKKQSPP